MLSAIGNHPFQFLTIKVTVSLSFLFNPCPFHSLIVTLLHFIKHANSISRVGLELMEWMFFGGVSTQIYMYVHPETHREQNHHHPLVAPDLEHFRNYKTSRRRLTIKQPSTYYIHSSPPNVRVLISRRPFFTGTLQGTQQGQDRAGVTIHVVIKLR